MATVLFYPKKKKVHCLRLTQSHTHRDRAVGIFCLFLLSRANLCVCEIIGLAKSLLSVRVRSKQDLENGGSRGRDMSAS